MVLWLIIGSIALAAAAAIVVAYRIVVRRYRDRSVTPHNDPEICFYLHDEYVMNMARQGTYKALKQEVELRTRRNRERKVTGQVHGVGAQAGQESEEEEVVKYIKDVEPITVIRSIIADLERAHNIVYIDLLKQEIEPGNGLDRALRGRIAPWGRSARLRDLDPFVFVSIKGRFRETNKTDTRTTFSAPYGDPDNPASEPRQISVTCVTDQLRRKDVPSGSFPARCLGKIQEWNPDTRKLVIDPVLAIFQ